MLCQNSCQVLTYSARPEGESTMCQNPDYYFGMAHSNCNIMLIIRCSYYFFVFLKNMSWSYDPNRPCPVPVFFVLLQTSAFRSSAYLRICLFYSQMLLRWSSELCLINRSCLIIHFVLSEFWLAVKRPRLRSQVGAWCTHVHVIVILHGYAFNMPKYHWTNIYIEKITESIIILDIIHETPWFKK